MPAPRLPALLAAGAFAAALTAFPERAHGQ